MDIAATKAEIREKTRSLPLEAAREVVAEQQDDIRGREAKLKNDVLVEIRRLVRENALDVDIRRKRGRPRKSREP